jgi:uncharacterized protein
MDRLVLEDPRGGRWLVDVATRRRDRMRGLIGRAPLQPGQAMLLLRTRSIHTFGMRSSLTVAFLDERFRIIAVEPVRPRRLVFPARRARHVLEAGADADLRAGDALVAVGPVRPVGPERGDRSRSG